MIDDELAYLGDDHIIMQIEDQEFYDRMMYIEHRRDRGYFDEDGADYMYGLYDDDDIGYHRGCSICGAPHGVNCAHDPEC